MTASAPGHLRCEYATDPLGIGTTRPRFFWNLRDERAGALQSAYQVQVAATREALAADRSDLWDSGRVESAATAQVEYEGRALGSRQRACWRVRSFDADGEASPWSEVARFEVGLLERSDWRASFIASPIMGSPQHSPAVPALRRRFQVDKPVRRARLYATALGLYQAEINGSPVGDWELMPGWTAFDRRVRYQVCDVAAALRPGENAIGALLGDGWYCGYLGLSNAREGYGERPALIAQLEIEYDDGTSATVVTDGDWRWHASHILEADLFMGETQDARQHPGDWTRPGFDDSAWQPVDVLADPGCELEGMPGPPVRAIDELRPLSPPERRSGGLAAPRWIFDLGQNMVGRIRLHVRGERGATLRIRHAEVLDESGELYRDNLRAARQQDHFTLAGTGEAETFEPRFTFHGFRYVEVQGRLEPDAIEELTGVVLCSDMPVTGAFSCSDPDLNQLQSNIVWGQKGNFVDLPTDCPQRDERLGWTGDAQVFVRTAAFNMDVAGFFQKWLLDLEDAQAADGAVPPVAPMVGSSPLARLADGGPAWADAVAICPWTIYRCYGDARLLEARLDGMQAYLDFLERRFPSLIRSDPAIDGWGGFGDWLALDGTDPRDDRQGGTPKDLIGTAFFHYSASLVSRMARAVGRDADAERYADLASRVREAFRKRFVSADGLLAGATQTSFVLPLHFGLLEGDERRTAAERLCVSLESRGVAHTTGFVGTPYLLHVLTSIGRLDLAYRLLLRTEYPSWLYTVRNGGTTMWERWNAWTAEDGFYDPEMNSFNHYAYGAVGEWMYGTLAGLDLDPDEAPETNAWRRARIAPRPPIAPGLPDAPLLTRAAVAHDTVAGRYEVDWSIDGDQFTLNAQVPAGAGASVRLPDGVEHEVAAGRHRWETRLDDIRAAEARARAWLRRVS
jgi:alpha-L-rhamnosidase